MKLQAKTKNEDIFDRLSLWFSTLIRFMLVFLLIITAAALAVGIVKAGIDLFQSIDQPLEKILQQVLLDTVFIVALLEITITIVGYLDDGHVHVRYIIDTVLIIMLNEIVSTWFKHPGLEYAIALSIIVATLAASRIAITRLTPKEDS